MTRPTLPAPPARTFRRNDGAAVVWAVSALPVAYEAAEAAMEERARDIAEGRAPELAWLLEHPPLYTAGVSAKERDLLSPDRFPVHRTGRGGQYTYHGPGQRVVYVMLDLRARGRDVRAFVESLEAWIIATLAALGVDSGARRGRVGVWVARGDGTGVDDKIAAVGVKLRKWVSFHGISLNVSPDLDHFDGIVPCGVTDHGVTSLERLGVRASLPEVDAALMTAFAAVFGPVTPGSSPSLL